jgi:archaellum component FlaC
MDLDQITSLLESMRQDITSGLEQNRNELAQSHSTLSEIKSDLAQTQADLSKMNGDLSNELSGIQSELGKVRGEIRQEVASVNTELSAAIKTVETALRAEVTKSSETLRGEIEYISKSTEELRESLSNLKLVQEKVVRDQVEFERNVTALHDTVRNNHTEMQADICSVKASHRSFVLRSGSLFSKFHDDLSRCEVDMSQYVDAAVNEFSTLVENVQGMCTDKYVSIQREVNSRIDSLESQLSSITATYALSGQSQYALNGQRDHLNRESNAMPVQRIIHPNVTKERTGRVCSSRLVPQEHNLYSAENEATVPLRSFHAFSQERDSHVLHNERIVPSPFHSIPGQSSRFYTDGNSLFLANGNHYSNSNDNHNVNTRSNTRFDSQVTVGNQAIHSTFGNQKVTSTEPLSRCEPCIPAPDEAYESDQSDHVNRGKQSVSHSSRLKFSDIKLLTKFSGSPSDVLPTTFLTQFEQEMKFLGVPPSQFLNVLDFCLVDNALKWYQVQRKKIDTYQDFQAALVNHYQNTFVVANRLTALRTERFAPAKHISVESFIVNRCQEMKALAPNISEVEIISSLIPLLPSRFQNYLVASHHVRFSEFLSCVQRLESLSGLSSDFRGQGQPSHNNANRHYQARPHERRVNRVGYDSGYYHFEGNSNHNPHQSNSRQQNSSRRSRNNRRNGRGSRANQYSRNSSSVPREEVQSSDSHDHNGFDDNQEGYGSHSSSNGPVNYPQEISRSLN